MSITKDSAISLNLVKPFSANANKEALASDWLADAIKVLEERTSDPHHINSLFNLSSIFNYSLSAKEMKNRLF